jgi:hypothetical protein
LGHSELVITDGSITSEGGVLSWITILWPGSSESARSLVAKWISSWFAFPGTRTTSNRVGSAFAGALGRITTGWRLGRGEGGGFALAVRQEAA